jgi:excisionase family DNA binding protein
MTGQAIPARELYPVSEAMALLSLSRTTIYEEFRAGRLESVHRGRTRLVPATAIADYVALLRREAAVLGRAS